MKKFLIVLSLMAFVAAGSLAFAAEKPGMCCVKGKIEKLTKADCKKAGGKIVKNAKACKPVK